MSALALLICIWGGTFAVIRIGLEGMPPFTGVALRFTIASVLLLLLAWRRGVPLGRTPIERRLWIVNGLLSFCVSYGVVYWAEQWVPSGLAAILWATFPLWVAVTAHWTLPGEQMTLRGVGGAVLALLGVAWIFADDIGQIGGAMVLPAGGILLLSPLSAAVANVAVKRWGSGIHPLSLTAVPMGICALVMGVVAWVFERGVEIRWDPPTTAALLYLAVAGSAVTFTIYYWLLSRLAATRLALMTYGVPVFAVVIGVAWLDEPLTLGMIVGTVLVLLGVALAMRPGSGSVVARRKNSV
jgi:drug/metabolite transporter (DMT)-like permease